MQTVENELEILSNRKNRLENDIEGTDSKDFEKYVFFKLQVTCLYSFFLEDWENKKGKLRKRD